MFMNRRFKYLALSLISILFLCIGVMIATDGIWEDTATGLTWAAKDNGEDVNFNQAYAYCENLELAGYSDWSLPTIEELTGLIDKSVAKKYKIKGPIELGAAGVYSSSMNNSGDIWSLSFSSGGKSLAPTGGCGSTGRALCVRRPAK